MALRGLRRERLLSVAVLLTLGLAFTGVALLAGLVDRLFVRPVPAIRQPQRIDRIFVSSEKQPDRRARLTWDDWQDLRHDASDTYASLTAWAGFSGALRRQGEARRVRVAAVEPGYFELLGVRLSLGRPLAQGPRHGSQPPQAVLSQTLWRQAFGASRAAMGQTVELNGVLFTISGVAPPHFRGMQVFGGPAMWIPLDAFAETAAGARRELGGARDRQQPWLEVAGRRRNGVTSSQRDAHLQLIARQLDGLPEHGRGYRLVAERLTATLLGNRDTVRRWVALFAGVLALVLTAACSNVGGLLLGKLLRRLPELSVRLALGEPRRLLAASVLAESATLTVAGAAVGLGAAALFGRSAVLGTELGQPLAAGGFDLSPSAPVVAQTLGVAIGCGLLIGALPAWRSLRAGAVLRSRSVAQAGSRRLGARECLVIAQIAVCFLVAVGAALATKTVRSLLATPLGYQPAQLVAASLDVAERGWDSTRTQQFFDALVQQLEHDPAIADVGLVSAMPMAGSELVVSLSFGIVGRPSDADAPLPSAYHALVDPGLAPTLGTRLVAGRNFSDADDAAGPAVAMINQAAARAYWPHGNPIGAKIHLAQTEEPFEIVGVVADARLHQLKEEPAPTILLAHAQAERSFIGRLLVPDTTVLARTASSSDATIEAIRRQVHALDAGLPLFDVTTLEQQISGLIRTERQAAFLFVTASLLALGLSMLGVLATAAHSVAARTRELGIRTSCGATPANLLTLVLRRAVSLALLGNAIGALAVAPLGRSVPSLLEGQSPLDPALWAAVALALTGFAALSALAPARRAARVDPVQALRSD